MRKDPLIVMTALTMLAALGALAVLIFVLTPGRTASSGVGYTQTGTVGQAVAATSITPNPTQQVLITLAKTTVADHGARRLIDEMQAQAQAGNAVADRNKTSAVWLAGLASTFVMASLVLLVLLVRRQHAQNARPITG